MLFHLRSGSYRKGIGSGNIPIGTDFFFVDHLLIGTVMGAFTCSKSCDPMLLYNDFDCLMIIVRCKLDMASASIFL